MGTKQRHRNSLLRWIVPLAIVFLIVSTALWDSFYVRSIRARAKSLQQAMTKEEVVRVLGSPTTRFAKGSGVFDGALFGLIPDSPEQWAYGSRFDWGNAFSKEPPYFFPFRFRLFAPDEDDVAIEFDVNGTVTRVRIP